MSRLAARLRELAELGDVAALTDLARELGGELGARLQALADGFDFEGVTRLADELAPA